MAPPYMPAVKHILKDVPAASYRTFEKFFVVKEHLAASALSLNNVLQGVLKTGNITDGSNNMPNFARMLMNCPIITEWCKDKQEAVGIGLLISGCRKIADDMLTQRVNDPDHYLGTPDDQEMVTIFGEYFGDIHIGTCS